MPDPNEQAAAADPSAAGPSPQGMNEAASLPQPGNHAPGPGGAAMLTPQPQAGKQMSAKIKVQVALHALMLAAREAGPLSEDGKVIFEAIQKLIKQFGKTEDEARPLVPAEMRAALSQAQPAQMPGALSQSLRPQAQAA